MVGVILILLVLVAAGPIAVMVGGAVFSALFGQYVGADAEHRAETAGTAGTA